MKRLQHKRFAFWLFAFTSLAMGFFHSGCKYGGIVALLGTPSYHESQIPAEYDLTEHTDERILVLVEQPAYLNARANLRYYLTRAINKNLTAKTEIPPENLISYSRLSEFRSSQTDFSLLSPSQVGAALDADMVLLVIIEDYQLSEMAETGYYKGSLDTQTVLLNVAAGEKLWPESAESKSIRVGFEVEDRGLAVALARLATASAYCTVRYLYNCRKSRFRIAEDRSSIGWEGWKK